MGKGKFRQSDAEESVVQAPAKSAMTNGESTRCGNSKLQQSKTSKMSGFDMLTTLQLG